MTRLPLLAGLVLAAVAGATPAAAKRDLAVPPTAGWQHAASGLILTAKLGGLARTELYDLGSKELDVVVQFASADTATQASIFVFKPALLSVPVWFDRSLTQIRLRSGFGALASRRTLPVAFAAGRSTVPDALRQSFAVEGGTTKSTALAMLPLNDWLIGIRLTSTVMDETQIDAKIDEIVSGLRFPASQVAGDAAVPMRPCMTVQKRFRARLMKPNMAQVLLGAMTPQLEAKAASNARRDGKSAESAKPLCRDGEGTVAFGIYRTDDDQKSYTLALGDAGRVATVSAAIALLTSEPGFQVIFRDLETSSVFPTFDRLPQPEQVLALIQTGKALSQSSDKTNSITIDAETLKQRPSDR